MEGKLLWFGEDGGNKCSADSLKQAKRALMLCSISISLITKIQEELETKCDQIKEIKMGPKKKLKEK